MKKIFTIILVIIVALGMAAGYLFSGLEVQPQQPNFTGPTGAPEVNAPTSTPSVTGPAVPWRQ